VLALLPFQSFFSECSHRDHLLASPCFSGALRAPRPLCCMFLFSSLFIVQFFVFFFAGQGSVCPRAMLVYPRGSCGNTNMPLIWSVSPSKFGASMWWCGSPPFYSV
jgi:hypothetical protein